MSQLRVRPEAEAESLAAAVWYDGERPGLGAEFLDAIRSTFQRIEASPFEFPVVLRDIRRAIAPRFPFGVFFTLDGDVATVVAIVHLHQHPRLWQDRR